MYFLILKPLAHVGYRQGTRTLKSRKVRIEIEKKIRVEQEKLEREAEEEIESELRKTRAA